MALDTASDPVRRLIGLGAWFYVAAGEAAGWSARQIADRLQAVFGAISPYSYNSLYAIKNRYDEAVIAGRDMSRFTVNPFPDDRHVGYPGLESNYAYQFIERFVNADDPTRSKSQLFVVNSDTPLSGTAARQQADLLIQDYLTRARTISGRREGGLGWEAANQTRQTAALKNI